MASHMWLGWRPSLAGAEDPHEYTYEDEHGCIDKCTSPGEDCYVVPGEVPRAAWRSVCFEGVGVQDV